MLSLMSMYDIVTNEEKVSIDGLFIELINTPNISQSYTIKYLDLFNSIAKHHHCLYHDIVLTYQEISVMVNRDYNQFFTNYQNKYKNNSKDILFDPITIEILNNDFLYKKYVKPITNIDEEEFFNKIKNYSNSPKFNTLLNHLCHNYNNQYYIKLMIFKFNKELAQNRKLSIKETEKIVRFFIEKQANDMNFHAEFSLIRITHYFKQLLDKRKRNFALQNINQYKFINAYHLKISDDYSNIIINISNFQRINVKLETSLTKLLIMIYHECRHAIQCNQRVPILTNIYEREMVIIACNNKYYNINHDFFETEIDAEIYGINQGKNAIENYFPRIKYKQQDNLARVYFLTNKYQKRLDMETKIDSLLLKNPSFILNSPELQKEYYLDGYPKGIMDILKQRETINNEEVIVYCEMIIRALNRMSEAELNEKISFIKEVCPFYISYIQESLDYEMSEMFKVYSLINSEYQKGNSNALQLKKFQNKIENYHEVMLYYYQQLSLINENNIAKR